MFYFVVCFFFLFLFCLKLVLYKKKDFDEKENRYGDIYIYIYIYIFRIFLCKTKFLSAQNDLPDITDEIKRYKFTNPLSKKTIPLLL